MNSHGSAPITARSTKDPDVPIRHSDVRDDRTPAPIYASPVKGEGVELRVPISRCAGA